MAVGVGSSTTCVSAWVTTAVGVASACGSSLEPPPQAVKISINPNIGAISFLICHPDS